MTIFDLVYQDIDYYPRPTSFLFRRLPTVLDGMTFIDVGCGNGRNSLEILRRGGSVIAIDPSAAGIAALHKRAEQEGYEEHLVATTDATTSMLLPPLDGAVLSTVLDHVPRPEAFDILRKVATALKEPSWTYASVFTLYDPGNEGMSRSETRSGVISYWDPIEFAVAIETELKSKVLCAEVNWEVDDSHGPKHLHHVARLMAGKGRPRFTVDVSLRR